MAVPVAARIPTTPSCLKGNERLRAQWAGIRENGCAAPSEEARRTAGLDCENLVELLEMRLDALVLRAGFACTRPSAQARQWSFTATSSLTARSSTVSPSA